jgi:hypothetical protein
MLFAKILGAVTGWVIAMLIPFGGYFIACILTNSAFDWRIGIITALVVTLVNGIRAIVRMSYKGNRQNE